VIATVIFLASYFAIMFLMPSKPPIGDAAARSFHRRPLTSV
jgi:hypothetical protein